MNPVVLPILARSFLSGEASAQEATARGAATLGRHWRWLRPLAHRYAVRFSVGTRPRLRDVIAFLAADEGFLEARRRYGHAIRIVHWIAERQEMLPAEALAGCALPRVETFGDLAQWCGVSQGELEWLADRKGLAARAGGPASHYFVRSVPKRSGGGVRVIESPKPLLKRLQRQVLAELLARVPTHPAAHGFVVGRSAQTFAAPHTGRALVLRMDLREFFLSIPASRIAGFFRTAGYPEQVAAGLTGLCTHALAPAELRAIAAGAPEWAMELRERYRRRHLPQGAPTSPALANVCAHRMDSRLNGLAGAAGFVYTRYADDLAFSSAEGRSSDRIDRFAAQVAAIVGEEGFTVNHRKTRVMRPAARQHLAGLVVNSRLNLPRRDFDTLKAILTNCERHGPESQNREGRERFRDHLQGRVAYVESVHAERGRRLRRLLEGIKWETPPAGGGVRR